MGIYYIGSHPKQYFIERPFQQADPYCGLFFGERFPLIVLCRSFFVEG